MAVKYLDLAGLTQFWTKAKNYIDTIEINGQPIGGGLTLDGTQINVGGSGTYAAETIQEAIDALDAAVKAADAKAGVTSFGGKVGAISINPGAGNVVFTMSENNLVGNVNLDDKATKVVALKDVEAAATADGSKVTITLSQTTEAGAKTSNHSVQLPVAAESTQGTTTWGKIKELARAEAAIAAGSTYKVKGTKANISEVIALTSATVGDVWNITAEFTLGGKKYPAGTNVVCIEAVSEDNAEDKWDALGGTVDLTPYATTTAMNAALAGKANTSHPHVHTDISDWDTTINAAIVNKADKNSVVSSIDTKVGAFTLDKTGSEVGSVVFSLGSDNIIKGTVDLSSKVSTEDLIAITTGEIDALFT